MAQTPLFSCFFYTQFSSLESTKSSTLLYITHRFACNKFKVNLALNKANQDINREEYSSFYLLFVKLQCGVDIQILKSSSFYRARQQVETNLLRLYHQKKQSCKKCGQNTQKKKKKGNQNNFIKN